MKNLANCKKLIDQAKLIALSTHIVPDADGIGSEIALCHALETYGKKVICINEEELPPRYQYLDPHKKIQSIQSFLEKNDVDKVQIDLMIVVDTSSPRRIGPSMMPILEKSAQVLYIDHHPAPKAVEAVHFIETSAAATAQLVGHLIKELGISFSQQLALPLYTAILIDTSSYRYPTVSGDTHRLVGELLDTGINPAEAYNLIYGTKKLAHMHLLGNVLSHSFINSTGEIAWLILNKEALDKYQINLEDTHSFVNNLLTLDGIKVACMFTELNGKIKVSFRTSSNIDVSAMAQALGGGGHNHSAAVRIKGKLSEVITETVQKLEIMLSSMTEE